MEFVSKQQSRAGPVDERTALHRVLRDPSLRLASDWANLGT